MICETCSKERAVIFQPHTGKALCSKCFIESVKERVVLEANKLGLMKRQRILLAVSGGKDSFTLVDTLSSFMEPSRLIAYNITEGIEGYNRSDQISQLREFLQKKGIDIIEDSFKGHIGYSLDEMMRASSEKRLNSSACTFCGLYRRRLINDVAREVGAEIVATGHNLDDEAQTIMINLLRGDTDRLLRFGYSDLKLSELFIERVKPLRKIYEWETTMYAKFLGYSFQERECPYISRKPTMRSRVRELMYAMEESRPGILLNIVENFDKVSSRLRESFRERHELPLCRICGEPTSVGREICKSCELLLKTGLMSVK